MSRGGGGARGRRAGWAARCASAKQSRDVKLLPVARFARPRRPPGRADAAASNAVVTAAAVVSLALALGACVAAFSLVDALILRPLPVRHPGQLVYLSFPTYTPERPEADTFNDPLFVRLRDASRAQVDLFAMSTQVMRPASFADGEARRNRCARSSSPATRSISSASRRPPDACITAQDDDRPGAHPVAVLSHAFWLRRFGGDPAIVGRWLTLEDAPARRSSAWPIRDSPASSRAAPTDLWVPYAMYNPRAFGNASASTGSASSDA